MVENITYNTSGIIYYKSYCRLHALVGASFLLKEALYEIQPSL